MLRRARHHARCRAWRGLPDFARRARSGLFLTGGNISGGIVAANGLDGVSDGCRSGGCGRFRPVFGEGLCAKVGGHGAEHAMHDGGGALVDALFVEGFEKQEEIDLERGAVLGEDEGNGRVGPIGNLIEGDDPGERGFDGGVVVAESGSGDGG